MEVICKFVGQALFASIGVLVVVLLCVLTFSLLRMCWKEVIRPLLLKSNVRCYIMLTFFLTVGIMVGNGTLILPRINW